MVRLRKASNYLEDKDPNIVKNHGKKNKHVGLTQFKMNVEKQVKYMIEDHI